MNIRYARYMTGVTRAFAVAALVIGPLTLTGWTQQAGGGSVFAQANKESKEQKQKDKEKRKEERQSRKHLGLAPDAANGPEPAPKPDMKPAEAETPPPTPETDAKAAETPEEQPAEGTTPPQPRVEKVNRPDQPSATVLPPPEEDQKGVSQEPPATPPPPVNNDRPKTGKPVNSEFYLDFQKQPLSDVVASIGPMVGKNFLLDPTVTNQEVTLITHSAIPADMIMPIFESVLNTYGFKMVETAGGNLVKIRPVTEEKEGAKLVVGNDAPKGYESYQFQVVQIKHAAATEVSQLLTEVGSKEAKVTVYERTNMLLLYGTVESIRKMMELIEQVDVAGFEEVVEFYTLEFTRAEVIAEQIKQVLMGDEAPGGSGPQRDGGGNQAVVRQPAPVARPTRPGAAQGAAASQQVIGTQALTLRITPDERLNALIVVASQPLMERVRDLIEKLDTPTPYDANNMHVRELLYADAQKVQEALQGLIGGASPRSGATPGGGNAARPAGGGATGGGGGGGGVASSAGGANSDVQPFEKNVTITMYESTNALLIIASPQDYKVLDSLIAQIDKPSRQVHVESIIMEVSIGDRFKLSVESAGLTSSDYFALNNIVNLANVLSSGPLASLDSGDIFNLGIIDGTTQVAFPDANGGSTTREVPNVPFLLQALESLTALDVISRPSLITVDNEEANIIDGQEIPIITGSQRSLNSGTSTDNSSVFNSVQREEVGVKMKVTPQISQGDYVFLDLDVEVSRPIQSTVGIDPNVSGVTLSKSNIVNKVVVRDGSTGILGGLISDSTDRARNQLPLLGDIPLLGSLFGRKDYQRAKRNLVILITPHIVKEGIDFERLTDAQMEKVAAANADVFFEKGIIKKIPQKAYLRSKYRPTDDVVNEVRGGSPSELNRGTDKGAK